MYFVHSITLGPRFLSVGRTIKSVCFARELRVFRCAGVRL